MTHYHVRISVGNERHDEVKTDIDEETLESQILRPHRTGEPITINGRTLTWNEVERVRISVSEEPSRSIIERIKAEDRTSSVVVLGGPSYAWRAANRARDVTDQYITGPPGIEDEYDEGAAAHTSREQSQSSPSPADPHAVFLVAGRDSKAVSAVGELLRALDLRVIEWEQAVATTGLPNPYVGDVVDTGLRMAQAALILLTPDDFVRLRDDLIRDDDGPEEREPRGQARPNVYYEAGIADTLGRERTVIMEVGNVKAFSDAAGRHVVRFDGSAAKRHALAQRLSLAGLAVNTEGEAWLNAGQFEPVLTAAAETLQSTTVTSDSTMVDKRELTDQVEAILNLHQELQSKSAFDDLSDLPHDSLDLVFQAQALIDRLAANTPYAAETEKVREKPAHVRIPVLMAALRALQAEVEGPD